MRVLLSSILTIYFAIPALSYGQSSIEPKNSVAPYMQWMSNNGYCGEVSTIQAAMFAGLWLSQFNMRLLCGAGLSQSGPDGFCEANNSTPNYNAQMLLESPNPGDQTFASASVCLKNAHLKFQSFDYKNQLSGMDGYKQFMSWIKERVILGDNVIIGVLDYADSDPQYDHEVTVSKIQTFHDPMDATYYDDDILFFEDHKLGLAAFTQGYTFAALAKTRQEASKPEANPYSILIPGGQPILSGAGGDGIHVNPHPIVAKNYGIAISGAQDPDNEILPVTLSIVGSTVNGVSNNPIDYAGFNYESPAIGGNNIFSACTNVPPAWMSMSLQVTANDLIPGVSYNLYEYEFNQVSGLGEGAALKFPDSHINAQAQLATRKISFVADSVTHQEFIQTTSDKVIVFRCVRADAP